MNKKTYSVSELNNKINGILKNTFNKQIIVTGEVSNIKQSKDHLYFTLKDSQSTISVVIWNYKKVINIDINNGDEIDVYGYITIYHKSGIYQINATNIKLKGIGDLYKQYQIIKLKYESLGYYDNKKIEPKNIKSVGVATAIDGAALQDFLYVLKKNKFLGKIFVFNCTVQGKDCPTSVANAVKELDNMNVDVIIIMRGGGSLEDLFGFSSPIILETIKNIKSYTVSAIGHEIDNMLIDYVSDYRAPTPSLAGEWLCKFQSIQLDIIKGNYLENYKLKIIQKLNEYKIFLQNSEKTIQSMKQYYKSKHYNIVNITQNIKLKIQNKLDDYISDLIKIKTKLFTLNPYSILNKGYCMIMDKNNQIDSAQALVNMCDKSKKLKIVFKNGYVVINTKKLYICEWKNNP